MWYFPYIKAVDTDSTKKHEDFSMISKCCVCVHAFVFLKQFGVVFWLIFGGVILMVVHAKLILSSLEHSEV